MANEPIIEAELRAILRRTYGRIKDVDDPRCRRAAGELRRALGVREPMKRQAKSKERRVVKKENNLNLSV